MAKITGTDPYPPQGIDLSKPSVARVYDYLLGGSANWAIDRQLGDAVIAKVPLLRSIALANRLFLHRAVRYLVRQGVRQFIDIGSGIPTVGNTHEVANELDQTTRVVYIDNEPVAVAHSTILLEKHGDPSRHAAVDADLRSPDRLWKKVATTGKINFDEPIGLLLIAVVHFNQPGPDGTDVGPRAVARYRELLPTGSYLALSHASLEGASEQARATILGAEANYATSGNPVNFRSQAEIRDLFGDFELVEPGITWSDQWHPEESGAHAPACHFKPGESAVLAGVAKKI